MKTVWAIMVDTAGAWEADCLYSLWTTSDGAEKERDRLNGGDLSLGCYNGKAHVIEVELDAQNDNYVEAKEN